MTMTKIILHLLETLTYRFRSSISQVDDSFANLDIGHGVRSPIEILYHMRGVMYYANKAITEKRTEMSSISRWDKEVALFIESVEGLKANISKVEISEEIAFRMVQGPISDALTHVGQLAMLSRVHGHPIDKENFFKADIGNN